MVPLLGFGAYLALLSCFYSSICSGLETSARIVGGSQVIRKSSYPFYAISDPFHCGATLIHPDVLLSAAHCQEVFAGQTIYIGGILRSGDDAIETKKGVKELIHPQFDDYTLENDVLLVKLDSPSALTIARWNTDHDNPAAGSMAKVIGFGDTEFEGSYSSKLLQVNLPIVDLDDCNDKNVFAGDVAPDLMLCAGGEGGRDSCQGDSGGPILDMSTGLVLGVVSWGAECGAEGFPGVYARTSAVDDFLRAGICSLSSDPPSYCQNGKAVLRQQPVNDSCENGKVISLGETIQGSTVEAPKQEINDCDALGSEKGVWFLFQGTGSEVEFTTCNSFDFDTKISVFMGSCASLLCVGSNDDHSKCGFGSSVSLFAKEAYTYYIFVYGHGTSDGSFELAAVPSFLPPLQLEHQVSAFPPRNDACHSAIEVYRQSRTPGTTGGSSIDTTVTCDTGSPDLSPGVWYSYLGTGEEISVDTCSSSDYDTQISIFMGSCGALTCFKANDDACGTGSSVSFFANRGTEYFILVHGFHSRDMGNFELAITAVTESPSMAPSISPAPTAEKPGLGKLKSCRTNVFCLVWQLLRIVLTFLLDPPDELFT